MENQKSNISLAILKGAINMFDSNIYKIHTKQEYYYKGAWCETIQ